MKRQFNVYDIIARIRLRPAMYLGECSLIRLRAFINGCSFLAQEFGIDCDCHPDFGNFHDWVAKKFGWQYSTAGWCNIILQKCGGDDKKALSCFFELIEEFHNAEL